MMAFELPLTATSLLASAAEVLESGGYSRITLPDGWPVEASRAYEDPYGVVVLAVYETWADLASHWLEAQAALSDLLGAHLARADAKAWEGYLVLLTPSIVPRQANLEADEIRRDTHQVRKLLATAEDLQSPASVEQAMLPLLPLPPDPDLGDPVSALQMVPELLAARGVSQPAVEVVVDAFEAQEPVVEKLHSYVMREAANED